MLLSAVSLLVVAQSSSEIPEGLMNNPVQVYSIIVTLAPSVKWQLIAVSSPLLKSLVYCVLFSSPIRIKFFVILDMSERGIMIVFLVMKVTRTNM